MAAPMQIDSELYDQYDKEWVARALWDPVEYQSFRNNQLRIQRAAIEQFPNSADLIADSQDRINWIEKYTPAGPVFPPSEPIGLTLLAYHCIERLKYSLAHMPFLSESKRVNINAVIRAYRSGSLIPKPGDITYWYAGIQKEDPGPPGQRDEALARWTKEHMGKDQCGLNLSYQCTTVARKWHHYPFTNHYLTYLISIRGDSVHFPMAKQTYN